MSPSRTTAAGAIDVVTAAVSACLQGALVEVPVPQTRSPAATTTGSLATTTSLEGATGGNGPSRPVHVATNGTRMRRTRYRT
jgi:hypothetical protein